MNSLATCFQNSSRLILVLILSLGLLEMQFTHLVYAAKDNNSGPLGYWKFNESSWAGDCLTADMIDSSGNNRHGTACIDGDAPYPVPGKFGNAGYFDGIYQYANMGPGFNFTSSFSAVLWIALDDYSSCGPTGKSQHIIGTHHLPTPTGNGRGWGIYWDCDGLAWELTNSIGSAIVSYGFMQPSPFPTNESWHHAALVYDSTVPSATLYWDGVLAYSESGIENVPSFLYNNGEPLSVNGLPYAPSSGAPGKIDDARVYNRVLSFAEIQMLFNNHPPVAIDDSYSTDENTPLNVAAPGVMGNDTDLDGDPLTAALNEEPTNGTLSLAADGSFSYTPNASFNGTDSFSYIVSDNKDSVDMAYVSIKVNSVNDGPGGVGTTDGSSFLRLWLKADAGTFSDPGCTTPQTANGGIVSCWKDQSGSGNDVSHSTIPIPEPPDPKYWNNSSESLNGQPVLDFMGSAFLERDISDISTNFTIFAVVVPSTTMAFRDSFFSNNTVDNVNGSFQLDVGGIDAARCIGEFDIFFYDNDYRRVCNGSYGTSPVILTYQWDSTSVRAWNNGSLGGTYASSGTSTFTRLMVGVNRNRTQPWPNDIAEQILYWTLLPDVERILVENYLSAKYDIIIATDVYTGDTNGDFDLNVAGIGQYGGTQHTLAYAAGMIVDDNTFLQDDGDWLLFGHNTPTNGNTSADLPWGTTGQQRWTRHFAIDLTDANTNGGTVNIIFDFSEGGMTGSPVGPASNYRLLKRVGTSGTFIDIATASTISGDQVHFTGVDVSLLGSNFTLGTLDAGTSPTALQLQDFSASSTSYLRTMVFLGVLSLAVFLFFGIVFIRNRSR